MTAAISFDSGKNRRSYIKAARCRACASRSAATVTRFEFFSNLSWNRTENHYVVYFVRLLQVAAGIHEGDDEQARRAAGKLGVQDPRLTFIFPELANGHLSD